MATFKLPSINTVVGSALATVKRFPMTLLCSLLGTSILIYLTHSEWRHSDETIEKMLAKILMCCELGLPLFLAFALLSETRKHNLTQKIIWQVVAAVLVTTYYFTIGDIEHLDLVRITRYVLFVAAAHLFVSFGPFLVYGHLNGFWQYNKTLFLRILLASLYTVVLYGGISLALWSIDELLHIHVNYKKYLYVWYVLGCLFNTLFFLAGIPANVDELENDTSYLKGLKLFTQYVLLPLVTLYLLILYAYIGKVLIQWKLPKGLVSYLVIGYSVAGIFSLLLIYPVRHNEENRWIRIFSRWFYLALFPLIILLSVSIFNRVAEYGITENRYFILVLALWLFCIATYFLQGSKENIKIIPISLCFLAVFTSFGPWGAFSVSEHSQTTHLQEILVKNKILVNGKIDKKQRHNITAEESDDIRSVVYYLDNTNSLDMIEPWFSVKVDTLKYGKASALIDEMNIVSESSKDWRTVYMNRRANNGNYNNLYSINIKGFDEFSTFYSNYYYREQDTTSRPDTIAAGYFMVQADSFAIYPERNTQMYLLKKRKRAIATVDLRGFLKRLDVSYDTTNESYRSLNIPMEKFMLDVEGDSMLFRFDFKTIDLEMSGDKMRIRQIEAEVLTKHK